jgi:hypothetical protein
VATETLRLEITAENRQAIAALKETAAQVVKSGETIESLTGKLTRVKSELDRATDPRNIRILESTIRNLSGQINALEVSVAGFGKEAVAAAEKGSNSFVKMYSAVRQLAYVLPGIGIAGIFNLAFEGIAKAADELGIFTKKEDESTKAAAEFNKELAKSREGATEEISKLKALSDAAANNSLSMHQRLSAVQKLRNEYPAYFKDLSDEQILTGKITTATDLLTEAIYKRAEARAREADIAKKAGQVFENQQKIDKLNADIEKARADKLRGGVVVGGGTLGGISGSRDEGYESAISKEISLLKEKDKLLAENSNINKEIALSQLQVNKLEAGSIDLDTEHNKVLKEKLTEAEKWEKFLARFKGKLAQEQVKEDNIGEAPPVEKKKEESRPRYINGVPQFADDARKQQNDISMKHDAALNASALKDFNEQMKEADFLAEKGTQVFDAFFGALLKGENIGDSLINSFKALATEITHAVVKALLLKAIFKALKIGGSIATGGVAGALAEGVGEGIGEGLVGGNKGYAEGGIASGPMSGFFAKLHGTEAIFPMDKLSAYTDHAIGMGAKMGGSMGGPMVVAGDFKVQGNDLVLALQRSNYSLNVRR